MLKKTYRGFKEVPFNAVSDVKSLIVDTFFKKVFADSPEGDEIEVEGETSKPHTSINFEELIQKARNEEKKKQYSTIEKLKTQIAALQEQHNSDLLVVAGLQKDNEDLKKDKKLDDSEEVKTLKTDLYNLGKVNSDLKKQIEDLEKQKPVEVDREAVEKEIREQLEKEYSVKKHRDDILREHEDDLLLPELVIGDTVEELDKNLEAALNRSKEIREKITGKSKKEETKPSTGRTPKPTNPSMSKVQDEEFSLDYISRLDPRSKEYKEFRKKLGLK